MPDIARPAPTVVRLARFIKSRRLISSVMVSSSLLERRPRLVGAGLDPPVPGRSLLSKQTCSKPVFIRRAQKCNVELGRLIEIVRARFGLGNRERADALRPHRDHVVLFLELALHQQELFL